MMDIIDGEKVFLKKIKVSDVTEEYLKWVNDPEITQYLEIRFNKYSLDKIKEYVAGFENKDDDFLFMIVAKENNRHIGNIHLGPINKNHKFAYVGIMIGDKDSWGKGYGTEAVKLVKKYACDELGLHKLIAGCYENNLSSIKLFQKAGFQLEGRRKKQFKSGNSYVDGLLFTFIND